MWRLRGLARKSPARKGSRRREDSRCRPHCFNSARHCQPGRHRESRSVDATGSRLEPSFIVYAGRMFPKIRAIILKIPKGKVATYGQVATAAGFPGAARQVRSEERRVGKEWRTGWTR